ncbi:MAG: TonB-dependent receptor [bacterium]
MVVSLTAQEKEPEKGFVLSDTVQIVADRYTRIPTNSSIATKIATPLRLTPASVSVVTSALFESQDGVVLGEALRNVSGVNSQTGFGVFDYLIIRGFESLSNGLVLTDGAAEPEVTFYNLYNLDRVEVLKGPGAFLYGGNPLSGTINLVRKQPIFDNFLHASGSAGKFQAYRGTFDLGLNKRESNIAFRLNGLWQDAENYRDDKNNKNVSVNPAFLWQPNERISLGVNLEYVDNEFRSDVGLPLFNGAIVDVPRTRSYQSPFDISDQKISRGRIDLNAQLSDNLTLRNKLYYTDLDWVSNGTLFNFVLPNPGGSLDLYRSLTLLDDRQKLFGNQLEAVFDLQTGTVKHKLLTGLEFSRLQDDFTLDVAALPPIDVYNPVETASEPFFLIPGQSMAGDANSDVIAPYFVDQFSFSEKVHVLLGGRYDNINFDDKKLGTTRDYNKFSPMGGLTFSPTSSFSVYASAGQAFAPPSTLTVGEREAEESTQFEAGIKRRYYDGRLNTTLAVYQLKKKNIAIPDDNSVTKQNGDQCSRGVELEAAAQPGSNFQMFLCYAYNDAELTTFQEMVFVPTPGGVVPQVFDRSGNAPAFAPKHLVNFWTNKEFKNGLGIGGGTRYIGKQYIAEDNAFSMDDALVFDAMLYYRLGQWRASVNFKNLTDQEYESRGFGTTSVTPANPFAVYGGLELILH